MGEKIKTRREVKKLTSFYKMCNHAKDYLTELVSHTVAKTSSYLRLHQLPSFSNFKLKLQQNDFQLKTKPTYLNCGDRYMNVLHTRLRNECSSLHIIWFLIHHVYVVIEMKV